MLEALKLFWHEPKVFCYLQKWSRKWELKFIELYLNYSRAEHFSSARKGAWEEGEQAWPWVRNWSFSEALQGLPLSRAAPWRNQLCMWSHPCPAVKPSWNVNFSEAFTGGLHLYLCLISRSCAMAAAPAASSSLLTLTRAFSPSRLVLSLAQTSLLWASSALLCGSPERQTALPDWWLWLLGTVVAQTQPDGSPGGGLEVVMSPGFL